MNILESFFVDPFWLEMISRISPREPATPALYWGSLLLDATCSSNPAISLQAYMVPEGFLFTFYCSHCNGYSETLHSVPEGEPAEHYDAQRLLGISNDAYTLFLAEHENCAVAPRQHPVSAPMIRARKHVLKTADSILARGIQLHPMWFLAGKNDVRIFPHPVPPDAEPHAREMQHIREQAARYVIREFVRKTGFEVTSAFAVAEAWRRSLEGAPEGTPLHEMRRYASQEKQEVVVLGYQTHSSCDSDMYEIIRQSGTAGEGPGRIGRKITFGEGVKPQTRASFLEGLISY